MVHSANSASMGTSTTGGRIRQGIQRAHVVALGGVLVIAAVGAAVLGTGAESTIARQADVSAPAVPVTPGMVSQYEEAAGPVSRPVVIPPSWAPLYEEAAGAQSRGTVIPPSWAPLYEEAAGAQSRGTVIPPSWAPLYEEAAGPIVYRPVLGFDPGQAEQWWRPAPSVGAAPFEFDPELAKRWWQPAPGAAVMSHEFDPDLAKHWWQPVA